jgi:hypothetical protein
VGVVGAAFAIETAGRKGWALAMVAPTSSKTATKQPNPMYLQRFRTATIACQITAAMPLLPPLRIEQSVLLSPQPSTYGFKFEILECDQRIFEEFGQCFHNPTQVECVNSQDRPGKVLVLL